MIDPTPNTWEVWNYDIHDIHGKPYKRKEEGGGVEDNLGITIVIIFLLNLSSGIHPLGYYIK